MYYNGILALSWDFTNRMEGKENDQNILRGY